MSPSEPASPAAKCMTARHFSCMLPHPPAPSTLVVLKHTSMAQSQQVPSLVTFKNSLVRTARQPLYKALLPCTSHPTLDPNMLAARFKRHRATALRLRARVAAPSITRSLPHPSRRPLLSSFSSPPSFDPASPSLPVWARPAVPYQHTAQLRTCADRCAARTSTLARANVRSWRGLVLQTHTEIGFTADRCDAKPALHTPAPCARSPLLFPPLSHLLHLFLASRSSRPIRLSPPSIAPLAFVPVCRRPHPTIIPSPPSLP
ncbi:hypothetical protein B0H14DRAFT_3454010 [Mycena olivaceomarginata]|nr:hypothetical protein B0H14DRAFT_3454010 [Mycena olivaceomarginata]